jgi:putative (di)nucleoside polyphosphate hydrolase
MPSHKDLPYRPCVGIMLLNASGEVWLGHRFDEPIGNDEGRGAWWQMPQGGIDAGEDARKAALRELFEETCVRSAEIIGEAPGWYNYDLPPHLVGKSWGGRYRGQTQKWFAMRFTGADSEISVAAPPGHKPEFDAWRWAPMDEVLGLIVPFKRGVYARVIEEFRGLGGG